MMIRKKFETALDTIMTETGNGAVTVSVTLTAEHWRAMFNNVPLPLRLSLLDALLQRCDYIEAAKILAETT